MTPLSQVQALRNGYSKMYEGLSEVLTALRACEEATLDWAESSLGDGGWPGPTEPEQTAPETQAAEPEQATPEPEKPAVTQEQVRAVLTQLGDSGKKDEVRKLITDHGGTKLPDVPEGNYAALLADAEKLL